MDAAAEWMQQHGTDVPLPLFGARGEWLHYSYETTGFGSVERGGSSTYRVTVVRPGDHGALSRHHRSVRSGRLSPGPRWRRPDAAHVHVIDREQLASTRADAPGSWLESARDIARRCSTDDEVARLAGRALRHLLWVGREHLDHPGVVDALAELRQATLALASERASYLAAVDRWAGAEVQDELESIRLEVQVMAEMRRRWDVA